ncbi:peptidoglycan-binding domain-containing protein [Scytonema sp. NUACC26]|uniref:peptidoglycan-binding domain-containing protein n=1 Tax=Scytonema sp. NUACC26 TaxID=3140176 RepID=UPI0034DC8110
MWRVLGQSSVSIATVCLITTSIVITDTALAALRYTPQQFRSVLRGLGYNIKVSNAPLTDADAKKVILEFQKGYKLKPADGVVGEKTQDFAANIVGILQGNLNLVVKPNSLLPKNQYYGPRTEAAVKLYQKKVGLKETGIADLALRQRLDQEAKDVLNKTTPTAEPTPTTESTPTAEPTPTTSPTSKPTPRRRPTSTPRTSPTPKPTSTPEASPTETPTPEATATPTPTPTP